MKVTMTYVGEAGSNVWGGVHQFPAVAFEKNKPVEIDTAKVEKAHKGFYEHMIAKARNNPFFEVVDLNAKPEDGPDDKKPLVKKAAA